MMTAAAPSFSMQQSNRRKGSTIQRESSYLDSDSGLPYITARGFCCAWWYEAMAIARRASCRTPFSCMKRRAFMANFWAGDSTP